MTKTKEVIKNKKSKKTKESTLNYFPTTRCLRIFFQAEKKFRIR